MASSSSSSRQLKHQVFLSFRGEDTRHNFTSHLLKALKDKGLSVFFDEEKLEKGKELSQALSKAILASNIAIIILSKDYASSKSCLAELSEIMEQYAEGLHVLPVFYHVEPSDVRKHGGSFKTSFDEHESRRPNDEVQRWKKAFAGVGSLKGWHIEGGIFDRSEPEYIKHIVEDVIKKLNGKPGSGSREFVGIDDQKETILKLIALHDSRVIGICGMGGMGKTTLADAVYNEVYPKFDDHYFLQNVSEKLEKKGRESLRNDLLSKLLEQKIRIDTPPIAGSFLIQQRLNNKRVFVVLDDVNDSDLIDYFGVQHFGHGSKILVTSRDKRVFKNGVDKIHEVNKLNKDDSLELFSKFAFKQSNPSADFGDLLDKFVKYAQGSPLALKVLGSNLYQRPRKEWESAADKLQEYPETKILKVLKISFDGLDELEKNIFLDIAFFFNEESKENVEKILSRRYKGALWGISNLVNKCLLDIQVVKRLPVSMDLECIFMHDLLQELGRDIVRNEYRDPRKRSRLCRPEDVYNVLKNNVGTESIEGIMLDMSQIDAVRLCPTVFKNMINLRVLKFYYPFSVDLVNKHCNKGLHADQVDILSLPDKLSYLWWDYYPFKSLPSNFNPKNLVVLGLRHGNMEQFWNEEFQQDLVNLRQICLDGCKNLKKIPNLFGVNNLETLSCIGCESLTELPYLPVSLRLVCLDGCKNLRGIHNLLQAIKLETISCIGCESLIEFPCLSDLVNLRRICLDGCKNLWKISNQLQVFNLETLSCIGCESLIEFPCLSDLINLRRICLDGCNNLRMIPNLLGASNLEILSCIGCEGLIEFLPLQDFVNLRRICLDGCKNLRKIPNLLGDIKLETLSCIGCESLIELPCLSDLVNLRRICLDGCKNLSKIPNLSEAIKLETLSFIGCESLIELPYISGHVNLRQICLDGCKNLRKIPNLSGATNLETFSLIGCESLIELPSLTDLVNLKRICLDGCTNLRKIPNLLGAINLEILSCIGCESLIELPCLLDLVNLRRICLDGCKNLRKIPNLLRAIKLETLSYIGCESLIELPCLPACYKPKKFKFLKIPDHNIIIIIIIIIISFSYYFALFQ